MNETFRVTCLPATLKMYELPPLMVITSGPIYWVLAQATSRKHRKYLAAQIILGQPFNRGKQ